MHTPVTFYSEGQKIVGDLFLPDKAADAAPLPAIVLCHGFAGIREMLLPAYAEAFAHAGFAALTFDYRGFGDSEGERGRLVPAEQIVDIRNAITFLETLPQIDTQRIGLWGTSFGGANAICTAAHDRRVKCLVVQITFGSGERMVTNGMNEGEREKLCATLQKAWQRAVTKNKPMHLPVDQILTDPDSKAFYHSMVDRFPKLKTRLPLLTIKESMEHKPENYLAAVNAPIMIIGADQDIVCPVEESKALFAKAHPPKELVIIAGARHYDVYEGAHFKESSGKAIAWFSRYLSAES
ncbi:MAG: alpha/beta fold hydrolase [Desulfobacterota bacterium]|nr:alpha/beta fold hydrolase [Thermodesulfobacteriota bacterium]